MDMSELDPRGEVIRNMNVGRAKVAKPPLTPRQEHLVREFCDDEGVILDADRPLLKQLLQSNST